MESPGESNAVALKCPQCGADLIPGVQEYIICHYCGSSLMCNRTQVDQGRAEPTMVRGIHLKPFVCSDPQGTGLDVFRMLIPAGWSTQGGCHWMLDNPGMPAVIAFQAWNPHGAEGFEILPNLNLIWNPMATMMQPPGSHYFGAEVQPPVGIREAFRSYVIPRYRSQATDLQLIAEEPLPELPRLVKSEAPLVGGSAEGGKVRICYTWQATRFEEEIYGVVEVFRAPIASMFGPVEIFIWFIDYLFSFRAAVGKLDATADLFSVMITSFQSNPHWYAAFKTITQSLAQQQIQHIRSIGEIGRTLALSGSQMREQNLQDWYSRQETYDRLATDWSRAIRDVDAFVDPHRQEVVELPSGYGHAWANNLGEYIITEDPNYNPNLSSNLHWEPMQPQQG